MNQQQWLDLLLFSGKAPREIWATIADRLTELAMADPKQLHQNTVFPDRILCESAYPLWEAFLREAPRTSTRLIANCTDNCAVLILDALSLREMPLIASNAQKHGMAVKVGATFSEAPSETNRFAQALGATSRAALKDNGKSGSFKLFAGRDCYTDVFGIPFADVPVKPVPNVVIWHSFLDDAIHAGRSVAELTAQAEKEFTGDGFWTLIDKLRQGRKLIITSDHGYGAAEQFSSEIHGKEEVDILRTHFKAQRYARIAPPQEMFMPPFFVSDGEFCMVTGQRKWKAPGGFPKVCHGGLSLLEVASPWIEINAK